MAFGGPAWTGEAGRQNFPPQNAPETLAILLLWPSTAPQLQQYSLQQQVMPLPPELRGAQDLPPEMLSNEPESP